MAATGELIRMMNYVDDIAATLRRINASLYLITGDEKRRLAEYMRKSDPNFLGVVEQLEKGETSAMAEVRAVAVIGAGIMGRGIAHAAALGGYRTILEDILPTTLRKAEGEIRTNLDKAVELGKVTKSDADQAFSRVEYASSVEQAAREADLIIEAVPEEMESKIEIFTLLDKLSRPSTILASNTSSLSVTEIASVTYRAPKCVGMHFFNPVHKMKLLEIVRALETDDETLAAAVDVGKRMGKEVVVIKESPGFITSRINAMIGNEAFYMLQEGVASPQDIDKALKLGLNHPMGPFEMVDLVGLDTRLHILEYLHKSLGEKFRPAPLMVQYVKAGRLGRKAGRGVYEYPGESAGRGDKQVPTPAGEGKK